MVYLVGTDPEFFLWNNTTNRYESAHGLIPGDKKNPYKIRKGAIQVDGTACEFNIHAASSKEEFVDNIDSVLRVLRRRIPKQYDFHFKPSISYDKNYFDSLPENSKELGCDPDYNAYKDQANPPPKQIGTMRTASGHIHIGWCNGKDTNGDDPDHLWDCREVVKALDSYFMPFMRTWDTDKTRAAMYGAPGAYRPKPYGVEYRTPSNAWLNHRCLWPWIFDSVQYVMGCVEKGQMPLKLYDSRDTAYYRVSGHPKLPVFPRLEELKKEI